MLLLAFSVFSLISLASRLRIKYIHPASDSKSRGFSFSKLPLSLSSLSCFTARSPPRPPLLHHRRLRLHRPPYLAFLVTSSFCFARRCPFPPPVDLAVVVGGFCRRFRPPCAAPLCPRPCATLLCRPVVALLSPWCILGLHLFGFVGHCSSLAPPTCSALAFSAFVFLLFSQGYPDQWHRCPPRCPAPLYRRLYVICPHQVALWYACWACTYVRRL